MLEGNLEFFAGLEFDHCPARNLDIGLGPIGVASHAGFPDLNLKDTEFPQLDVFSTGQSVLYGVECVLNNFPDHVLLVVPFVVYFQNDLALGEVGSHGYFPFENYGFR